MTADVLA